MTATAGAATTGATPSDRRATRMAWIALGFGAWTTAGLVLVLWALARGQADDDIASVYHIPLYLGLGSLWVFCAVRVTLAVRRGHGWKAALPAGYELLGIGALLAMVGFVLDLGWREGIGVVPGIEDTLAPTRIAIIGGLILVAISPLRASLALGPGRVPALAALLSAGLALGIIWIGGRFHPAISPWLEAPDESLLASSEIWVMDADGSHQTRLVEEDDPQVGLGYASWSPDGSLIAYTHFLNPSQDVTHTDADVWTVNPDGADPHLTIGGAGMQWIPRVAPDGASIAYTQEELGGPWAQAGPVGPGPGAGAGGGGAVGPLSVPLANADIWRKGTEGDAPAQQLTDSAADDRAPVFSPDGSLLLFDTTRDGNTEIYVMGADGADQRNLTNDEGEDWGATWSPDGTQVAFNSSRGGPMDIWVMGADGSDPRQVTFSDGTDGAAVTPSWSPDGSRIAYTYRQGGDGPGEIWSVLADGGDPRNLSRSPQTSDDLWTGGWGRNNKIVFSRGLPNPPETSALVREDFGAVSVLFASALLAVMVVAVVKAGAPFGSFTLLVTLAMVILAIPIDAWRFVPVGTATGLAVDAAVYRSGPSLRRRVAPAIAGVAFVLATGLTVLATDTLFWSPTLLLGVATAAGVIGWGIGAISSDLQGDTS
jgi:WD40 repeat protein